MCTRITILCIQAFFLIIIYIYIWLLFILNSILCNGLYVICYTLKNIIFYNFCNRWLYSKITKKQTVNLFRTIAPLLTDKGLCCSFNKVYPDYIFQNQKNVSNVTFPNLSANWTPKNGKPPAEYTPWRPGVT